MRREPDCEVPEVKKPQKPSLISYQVITPIFGGGVEAGKHDEVTPVRGSSIRGQLRFWWRATRGGAFDGDLSKMKKREDEIWGAASTEKNPAPSQVQIEVQVTNNGSSSGDVYASENKVQKRWEKVAYAVFPLAPDPKKAKKSGSLLEGVSFSLKLTFPESVKKDVEAALWAWEMFGGIGARTRRGFGAIARTDAKLIDQNNLKNKIQNDLKTHVVEGRWPEGVPHLSRNATFKITNQNSDLNKVWEELIKKLKAFRQYRKDKNGNKSDYGKSAWPEPNAIRYITGRRKAETIKKFPRARFGLPIIFHFKDKNEPPDTTLKFKDAERLASPLILRPVKFGSAAFGLAILLETEGLDSKFDELVLQDSGKQHPDPVKWELKDSEARDIDPLRDKKNKTDVLKAFLETI